MYVVNNRVSEKCTKKFLSREKRKKQKVIPYLLNKSSLCIMNVDDDDEVFIISVTERERDPV